MITVGGDDRVNVQVTWPKIIGAVLPVVGVIGVGYWTLIDRTINGINQNIALLREDAGKRFDDGSDEDRDIRRVIEDVQTLLRVEMQASRTEFGSRINNLGDRIVAANEGVGKQIELLRTQLTASMDKRDQAVQGRFDRMEQKMTTCSTGFPMSRSSRCQKEA
jgi:hypothetical protein